MIVRTESETKNVREEDSKSDGVREVETLALVQPPHSLLHQNVILINIYSFTVHLLLLKSLFSFITNSRQLMDPQHPHGSSSNLLTPHADCIHQSSFNR